MNTRNPRICRRPGQGRSRLGVLLVLVFLRSGFGAVIYGVPEKAGEVVGAWDVNILADDVHFETASIIREIHIRLAIAGEQTCKLWVFDGMNRPPLHVIPFTNAAALNPYDVSTYVFEMHLQVPKDIHVGFSAQGDGWTNTLSDYWSWGPEVLKGVEGTLGTYAFGPVSGGQLTTMYVSGTPSFGCLQVLSEPVSIDRLELADGQARLTLSSLPIHAANVLERSETPEADRWEEALPIPPGMSNHVGSVDAGEASRSFFRIRSR